MSLDLTGRPARGGALGEGVTLGVEEEFQIVDRESGELVARSHDLVPVAREVLGDRVTSELNRCQVETATGICDDLEGIRDEVGRLRRDLDAAAAGIGCGILPVGAHPWSSWRDQEIEHRRSRYREMEDRYQRVARQQVICGCHVHVGLGDPDRAVATMTHLRPWLPVLLALSANSPFWNGEDTGYDSYRLEVWARWPTAGMPPALVDREAYDAVVAELTDADAIADPTHLYWYVRPSERFPTLELRVADVCLTLDDVTCIAGLSRALVRTAVREAAPDPDDEPAAQVLDAALWRAARYGLHEDLVSPVSGDTQPAATVVAELLDHVGDALDELGDRTRVTELTDAILRHGNGADRQRAARSEHGDPAAVVAMARAALTGPAD